MDSRILELGQFILLLIRVIDSLWLLLNLSIIQHLKRLIRQFLHPHLLLFQLLILFLNKIFIDIILMW